MMIHEVSCFVTQQTCKYEHKGYMSDLLDQMIRQVGRDRVKSVNPNRPPPALNSHSDQNFKKSCSLEANQIQQIAVSADKIEHLQMVSHSASCCSREQFTSSINFDQIKAIVLVFIYFSRHGWSYGEHARIDNSNCLTCLRELLGFAFSVFISLANSASGTTWPAD